MVRVIGIGGGAGTGKTTVASFLREQGVKVLELDELSRELSRKGGPIWKKVIKTWGRFFVDARGNIDRKKLGKVVFRSFKVLFLLNRIAHPLLLQETRKWLNRNRKEKLLVIDGAILFEGGFLPLLDRIVFVEIDSDLQQRRLVTRGWKEKDARSLIEAQKFLRCLRRRADLVICNRGSRKKLYQDIEKFLELSFHGREIERGRSRF